MKIKERFTVAVSQDEFSKVIRAVYDHKQKKQISEMEAERICYEEYGEHFSARTKVIKKACELILAEMELYNETCMEGFEISINDVTNRIKQNNKYENLNTNTPMF